MSKPPPELNCDTIPVPQNLAIDRLQRQANGTDPDILSLSLDTTHVEPSGSFDVPTAEELLDTPSTSTPSVTFSPAGVTEAPSHEDQSAESAGTSLISPPRNRKLCVRHLRMADEGTLTHLQRSLDALPIPDRAAVNTIWSTFSSSSPSRRATILQGILTMCCFSQLSFLTEQLNLLIRLDPFSVFPKEISLRVLSYLDAFSLCRSAQVSKAWNRLAEDDVLWHDICEQHIGHTCSKCGWGLPLLREKKHNSISPSASQASLLLPQPLGSSEYPIANSPKRELDAVESPRPAKRQKSVPLEHTPTLASSPGPSDLPEELSGSIAPLLTLTRPWKSVYYERLTIERNWRRGRCTIRTLEGHTDGVMCMQFSETLAHPSFPVLITGSYDRTARVWNLETGQVVNVLHGHGRAVRALQFDNAKLITGSMDRTLKVWNWRTGACIRTLEGHTEGVVCLNFDSNVLASGSVDATVKIWNFRNGECFTLRGHHDWVNSLQLWDSDESMTHATTSSLPTFGDVAMEGTSLPDIDPGKMLFSASDDGTIKLWDLAERTCVKTFTGHVGQVQSIKLLTVDAKEEEKESPETQSRSGTVTPTHGPGPSTPSRQDIVDRLAKDHSKKHDSKTILISGSLDNTIKVWDIDTAKDTETLFGHVEGIWGIAASPLRIVSASHDRTIKIWNRENGQCTSTLVGHTSPVTCLAMSDDKIVSGCDDGKIRIWDFSP